MIDGYRTEACYGCGVPVGVERSFPDGGVVICGVCITNGVPELAYSVDDALAQYRRAPRRRRP